MVAGKESKAVGRNAICYEAVFRRFRNALVGFLRERMIRIFGTEHLQRLKKPFEKEWEAVERYARQARAVGGTVTKIKDEYDLLSVSHFYSLFEAYFDKLFSAPPGQVPECPKPNKTKLLGNLKSVRDARDPLAHPVEEEVSYEEAFGLLTDARQILAALGLQAEAEEISALAAALDAPDEGEGDQLICGLPTQDSIYFDFVGRNEVLKEIATIFCDPQSKRCLLAGDGGKGKSAIAYRYAREVVAQPRNFQLVLWMSAKQRKFLEGRTVPISNPDFTDIQSAVDRLLMQYGFAEEVTKPLPEKRQSLLRLLNEFPAFIVVDDIDTVLDDSETVGFFTFDLPNTRSCVLLTSRRDVPGIRRVKVDGFTDYEADSFVKSRVQLYGLDAAAFPPAIVKELTLATDRSPLYMDDLMRLARLIDVPTAVKVWKETKGDKARAYALQRELGTLSSDAKKVVIAATVADHPVSFAELEAVLSISEDRLMSALTELQTMFLFPKPRLVEGEQRFEINSNTRRLVEQLEGSSDAYARLEAKSKALAGRLPDVGRGFVGAMIRQAWLLKQSGRFQQAEALLLNATERYPNAADLEGFLGFLYHCEGRTADARGRFEAADKLSCKNPDTYRHWIKMEMYEKEWTRAVTAADRGLKRIAEPDSFILIQLKAEAKLRLGQDLAARLQHDKARKLWTEAADDLKGVLRSPETLRTGERSINSAAYRTLVICLDLLGEVDDLNTFFSRWKSKHPDDPELSTQKEIILRKRGSLFRPG